MIYAVVENGSPFYRIIQILFSEGQKIIRNFIAVCPDPVQRITVSYSASRLSYIVALAKFFAREQPTAVFFQGFYGNRQDQAKGEKSFKPKIPLTFLALFFHFLNVIIHGLSTTSNKKLKTF